MHTPRQYLRDSATARLGAFAATLIAVFGIAALAGAAIGPEPKPEPSAAMGGHGDEMSAMGPAGLAIAQEATAST